jgi:3,4-dihydroxy 2-butanone 4-phosphate synthase/GTP cyclohydrolase II
VLLFNPPEADPARGGGGGPDMDLRSYGIGPRSWPILAYTT